MFIKENNKINWLKTGVAFGITIVLTVLLMLFADRALYLATRGFDHSALSYFDIPFAWWITASITLTIVFKAVQLILRAKQISPRLDYLCKIIAKQSLYVFGALISSGFIAGVIKFTVGRSRPCAMEFSPDLICLNQFAPFSTDNLYHSFPSGHTTAAFAALVMLGLLNPKWKWLTWTLAICFAAARIISGQHWASDVLFGAVIGMIFADVAKVYLDKIVKSKSK